MAFNKKGRFYERGKGLSEELKGQIIDKILETGYAGSYKISGYFPAKWTELDDKLSWTFTCESSFRSPLFEQAHGVIFSNHVTFFRSHDHLKITCLE